MTSETQGQSSKSFGIVWQEPRGLYEPQTVSAKNIPRATPQEDLDIIEVGSLLTLETTPTTQQSTQPSRHYNMNEAAEAVKEALLDRNRVDAILAAAVPIPTECRTLEIPEHTTRVVRRPEPTTVNTTTATPNTGEQEILIKGKRFSVSIQGGSCKVVPLDDPASAVTDFRQLVTVGESIQIRGNSLKVIGVTQFNMQLEPRIKR